MNVREIAESIPGPSTRLLGDLARELKVYICAGIVERSDGDFYNSQVLLDPDGALAGHHRKKSMWTPGDSLWCRRGDTPVQVVDTEFGRLGLMICHDFHILPPKLAEQGADIVLYSVGWYGPNEKNWFSNIFPRRAVVPHGFDVVVANWSGRLPNPDWPGSGHSCIISGAGEVLAMARSVHGNEIVIADITIRNRKSSTAVPSELREEI